MKKAAVRVFLLLTACLVVWLGMREKSAGPHGTVGKSGDGSRGGSGSSSEEIGTRRTKVAVREESGVKRTHSPERLREFMLPPVRIEGLALEPALQKLMEAYREACGKAGETALPLTFSVPPDSRRKLDIRLPARNFSADVGTFAALSGMKVERKGTEYSFEPLPEGHGPIRTTLRVSPDFSSTLAGMSRSAADPADPFAEPVPPKPIAAALAELGVELAQDTTLSLGANGELTFEGTSATDEAALAALARLSAEENPVQMKHDSSVLQIPADAVGLLPDLQNLDANAVQILMRKIVQTKGVDLMTVPTVTNRNGNNSTIEIIREVIYPKDAAATHFESRNVGLVMQIKGSLLGFGEETDFNFSHTKLDGIDAASGKPIIKDLANLSDAGYSGDGSTRLSVQTHPDGSKTLVLITNTQIDATGRPIH